MPLSTEGSLLWEQARPRSASLKRMKPKFRATTCWHTPTALIMEIITWQLPPVLLPIIIRWAGWTEHASRGSDWLFRMIRTNGLSASAMQLPLPMEVLNGNAVHYPYLHAWSTTIKVNTCSTVLSAGMVLPLSPTQAMNGRTSSRWVEVGWCPKKNLWKTSNGWICWKSKHLTVR